MRDLLRATVFSASLAIAASSAAQAQSTDRLAIGLGSFPATMHPLGGGQASRSYVLAVARRDVTRYDATWNIECQLCTEIPSAANGRAKVIDLPDGRKGMEVTYTLRPGLKWGDGTPLTTRDIVFGAEVARSLSPQANVTGVVARDDHTYTVMLNAVRFDFDRLSPQPLPAAIEEPIFRAAANPRDYLSKSAFNLSPNRPGLWNGPYLVTGFTPNQDIAFAPNPYWDGEKPGFKQVSMRLFPGSAALETGLLAGDIAVTNGMGGDQTSDLQHHHGDRFDFASFPNVGYTNYLVLQLDNPLLADKRVRHALAMAINKQEVVERLDGRVPVANSILAVGDPNYDKDVRTWPYDPARARALLAEAGYAPGADGIMARTDGTRLSLDLVAGEGAGNAEIWQQAIQSQLKQVGIEAVTKSEPFRVLDGTTLQRRQLKGMVIEWFNRVPGTMPLGLFSSTGIPRESNSWAGANYMGYSNPQVDALLNDALVELDPAKRQVLWKEIQAAIMEDLPQIPLSNGTYVYISPKWLTGVVPPRSTASETTWIEYWKPRQQ